MREQRSSEHGFTLIELMISLVLFSFAIAGVLAVAVSMAQGMREQRQAVQAEAAVRVPMDFLADALRQASPGVPLPKDLQDAGTCALGAVSVLNDPGGTYGIYDVASGTDVIDVVYAAGAVVTSSRTDYQAGSTTLTVNDASQLSDGDYIVITDFTHGHLVRIASKAGNVLTLDSQCSSGFQLPTPCAANCAAGVTAGYGKASTVIRAQHARFFVTDDLQDGTGTSALMMDADGDATTYDPEPLAEGIEDMQVAVGVEDGTTVGLTEAGTTTDEWLGNASGDAAVDPAVDNIRAIRVTLIARTGVLVGTATPIYQRPAAEDNAAGTADAYRRRVLRTIVELRNNGSSP